MKAKKNNQAILYILLTVIALIFVVPIFYSLFNSLKGSKEILNANMTFFPHKPTIGNYQYVFTRGAKYLNYYKNSIIITFGGVLMTVLFSALGGYSFAKLPFKGSNVLMTFILFVVAFPLSALLIPIYIMEYNTGLLNTSLGLILPNVMNVLPFSVFILRGIFKGVPHELEESAEIDGCSVFKTWLNIMLPIARNGLVIVVIFSFYTIWGEYTMGRTLATQDNSMPISVALTMLKGDDWNFGVLGAAITMTIIPPIIVFLLFQNRLVEGIVQGAVKG